MKYRTVFLSVLLTAVVLGAEGYSNPSASADTLRLDFEQAPNFSLSIPSWQCVDLDHHITYGILNHTYPNDTVAKAFMCFNPSAVTPPMTDTAILPHSGSKFGACFSAIPPSNNDWLISPKVHLGQYAKFSAWVKSYTALYQLEEYKVLISVTDSAPSSFTPLSGAQPLLAPVSWTKQSFDLSAYANQNVFLAIQCVSADHFIFMVDDIEIITSTSGSLLADFSANKTQAGIGEAVNFQDLSSGFPTTWTWSFPGGTPSSSTARNPAGIIYSSPGDFDVSLTVTNGLSTNTKTVAGYIHVGGYPSSASLDFESLANFTLDLSPWTTLDVKGGATYPIEKPGGGTYVFPHSGQQMSYICFNPSATVPPEPYMKPHTGQKLGCCFSSIPPNNPNNKWLISPRLSLGASSMLRLWVMTYNKTYGLELYRIAVSTTDNNPSSFVYLTSDYETAPEAWTLRTYDLKDYNNKTVYVAIQCVSDDQFIFMVDDIQVTSVSGTEDEMRDAKLSVFPNPARSLVNFSFEIPHETLVRADLLDVLGKTIRTMEFKSGSVPVHMDIHDLEPGVYSLVFNTAGGRLVRKLVIQ